MCSGMTVLSRASKIINVGWRIYNVKINYEHQFRLEGFATRREYIEGKKSIVNSSFFTSFLSPHTTVNCSYTLDSTEIIHTSSP